MKPGIDRAGLITRLRQVAETHQTIYEDDRYRKALFAEAAAYIEPHPPVDAAVERDRLLAAHDLLDALITKHIGREGREYIDHVAALQMLFDAADDAAIDAQRQQESRS